VQLLISDANILIDMEEGRLIEQMFLLPYQFSVPDILFYEELEEQHTYLLSKGLQSIGLSSETMQYAQKIISKYPNPSRNDCFALSLAFQEECSLLTGDKDLREAAEKEGVIVMGTIWIVNQMIKNRLITADEARLAYKNMKITGRRLPWNIAEAELIDIERDLSKDAVNSIKPICE